MSEESKILDIKILLESEFPNYAIDDKSHSKRYGTPQFKIIHNYEIVATIEFRRNVWDDLKTKSALLSFLSKINIASKIRDNIGKTIIVTEDGCILAAEK